MATEDFTTYTEVDEDGDISKTADRVTVDTMRRDALSYVRSPDFGAGHFGDFEHLLAISVGSFDNDAYIGCWGLSDGQNTLAAMNTANLGLSLQSAALAEYLTLIDYTNDNTDNRINVFGAFWLTVERSGTTLTCKIYDDGPTRTNLIDTLSIVCGTDTYRYIYAVQSRNATNGDANVGSLYVEYLDLQETAPILVTPTTLALVLTLFAPTVTITLHQLVTPTTLALVLTRYAPTVSTPRLVTPTTLALSITSYIPIIAAGVVATPSTLALILTSYIPITLIPMRVFFRIAFATDPFAITPTWVDVSSDLVAFTMKRGRQNQLDRIESGTATILLKNLDGDYWPDNDGGTYYPEVKIGKRVNIRVTYNGTIYDEYTGFIRRWNPMWFSEVGNLYPGMMLECADLQRNLARAKLNHAGYAQQLSGTRVGNVLTTVGWPAADRDIDAGKENMIATGAMENVNSMEHLFKVQESELSMFFIRGDGYTVFHERGALEALESQATFGTDNLPIYDPDFPLEDDLLYNEVRLNRVSGTEQAYSDAASILAHSLRTLARSGLLLISDVIVYIYCVYLVARYHDVKMRIKSFTVKPQTPGHETTLWPLVLGLEIGQKITLVWTEADINGDYFIEGKEHNWDYRKGVWVTKFQCSDAAQFYFEPDAADITLQVTANGTLIEHHPSAGDNWDCVDEIPVSDADYVINDAAEQEDRYTLANSDYTEGTINSVKIIYRMDSTGNALNKMRRLVRVGGTNYYGDWKTNAAMETYTDTLEVSPDTEIAWTWAEVNAMEIGIQSDNHSLYDYCKLTQIYVVVNVTPAW